MLNARDKDRIHHRHVLGYLQPWLDLSLPFSRVFYVPSVSSNQIFSLLSPLTILACLPDIQAALPSLLCANKTGVVRRQGQNENFSPFFSVAYIVGCYNPSVDRSCSVFISTALPSIYSKCNHFRTG